MIAAMIRKLMRRKTEKLPAGYLPCVQCREDHSVLTMRWATKGALCPMCHGRLRRLVEAGAMTAKEVGL